MEKQTDDQIAVAIVKETQTHFPSFKACSFDKGFHSPANQTELKAMLDQVTLPKKGKLSSKDEERETGAAFVAARKAHSAQSNQASTPWRCMAWINALIRVSIDSNATWL